MRHIRNFTIASITFFLGIFLCSQLLAQQTTHPTLRQRSQQDQNAAPPAQSTPGQPSTLPNDVSGEYEFGKLNDWVEIDIHRNRLSGYITRLGDAESDSNTPLTYFFDRTSIDGSQFEFETRVVHGIWYSFHGTIFRGDGKTRQDEGYYVLHGVLIEHHPESGTDKSADETYERRIVNFKSMGQ